VLAGLGRKLLNMGLPIPSTEDYFWSLLDKSGGPDACWLWPSERARSKSGYGEIKFQCKWWRTHRLALYLSGVYLEPGTVVMHSCDTPPCCNPKHLSKGSRASNTQDMVRKGRNKGAVGIRNWNAKLSEAQVQEIYCAYHHGLLTQTYLGRKYHVSQGMIGYIVRDESWTHLVKTCTH
jgi:hypothetical protein